MQSREQQLLAAIRENPDGDRPRLDYADWCDLWDDPRGEFIRVQCALAQTDPWCETYPQLEQRQHRLLQEFECDWINKEMAPGGLIWGIDPVALNHVFHPAPLIFQRGFLEGATAEHGGAFTALKSSASSRTLLRYLRVESLCSSQLPDLLASPAVKELRGLFLSELRLREREAEVLAHSPQLSALTHLGAPQNEFGPQGAITLLSSPYLRNLRWLDLADNDLNDDVLEQLIDWPDLEQLECLDLGGNSDFSDGGAELFAARTLPQLRMLSAWQVGGAARLVEALASAKHLNRLTHLLLARNRLDDEPVVSLLRSSTMDRVQTLWLEYNWLGNQTAAMLAESPFCQRLEDLNLGYNAIGDQGVLRLAESPQLHRLRALNLRMNPLTDKGALAIARSPHLRSLECVHLGGVQLMTSTRQELCRRFGPGLVM